MNDHRSAGGHYVREGPGLGLGAGIGTLPSRVPKPGSTKPLTLKPRRSQPAEPKSNPHAYATPLTSNSSNSKGRAYHPAFTGRHGTAASLASARSAASSSSSPIPSRMPRLVDSGAAHGDRLDHPDLYPSLKGNSASSSQSTLQPSTSPRNANSPDASFPPATSDDHSLDETSSSNGYRPNVSSTFGSRTSRSDSPDSSGSQPASSLQHSDAGTSWQTRLDQLTRPNGYGDSEPRRPSYALSGGRSEGSPSPPLQTSKRESDHFTRVPRPSRTRSKRRPQHRDKIASRALVSPPPFERRQPMEDHQESSAASAGTSATTATFMTNMDLSTLSNSTGSTAPTTITNGTSSRPSTFLDNDEMHLALLAGQAAIDCNELPISTWDEVETWKKELSLLSSRLNSLHARHKREVKILTAARTLQKLNTANKRMSRHTMESLEQSERRVAEAEKVSPSEPVWCDCRS